MSDVEEIKLWERKMSRAIYGDMKREDGWRRRINEEIEGNFLKEKILTFIKAQRIRVFSSYGKNGKKQNDKNDVK